MKTKIQYNDYENMNCIYVEAEKPEENAEIIAMIERTRKPNDAYGNMRQDNGLVWAWFRMPAKKNVTTYSALSISSEE